MGSSTLAISVRRAQPADTSAIAALVNRAYEVEEAFVDGPRTSEVEIARLVHGFLVLEQGGALVAAVYVEVGVEPGGDAAGYVGMLSVDPAVQGMGIGTRLVRIAEAMCDAMGATHVRLQIVNLREELGRWYRGLGYRAIGTSPFDDDRTKQPCHFIEMRKELAPAAPVGLGSSVSASG